MENVDIKLQEKLIERKRIFNTIFGSAEGLIVYKDLRSALVINPELITRQYTNDDVLSSHLQVGMRLAFQYIDDFLDLKTINK
jgi:hypothetical protein